MGQYNSVDKGRTKCDKEIKGNTSSITGYTRLFLLEKAGKLLKISYDNYDNFNNIYYLTIIIIEIIQIS